GPGDDARRLRAAIGGEDQRDARRQRVADHHARRGRRSVVGDDDRVGDRAIRQHAGRAGLGDGEIGLPGDGRRDAAGRGGAVVVRGRRVGRGGGRGSDIDERAGGGGGDGDGAGDAGAVAARVGCGPGDHTRGLGAYIGGGDE